VLQILHALKLAQNIIENNFQKFKKGFVIHRHGDASQVSREWPAL
jgi:hypothetical protein